MPQSALEMCASVLAHSVGELRTANALSIAPCVGCFAKLTPNVTVTPDVEATRREPETKTFLSDKSVTFRGMTRLNVICKRAAIDALASERKDWLATTISADSGTPIGTRSIPKVRSTSGEDVGEGDRLIVAVRDGVCDGVLVFVLTAEPVPVADEDGLADDVEVEDDVEDGEAIDEAVADVDEVAVALADPELVAVAEFVGNKLHDIDVPVPLATYPAGQTQTIVAELRTVGEL